MEKREEQQGKPSNTPIQTKITGGAGVPELLSILGGSTCMLVVRTVSTSSKWRADFLLEVLGSIG
jgi:hypothetical protein